MKMVRLCFVLAIVSAGAGLVAAGVAMATPVVYSNMRCATTPGPVCPTACGCPTSTVEDRCEMTAPPPGLTSTDWFYCLGGVSSKCMAPTQYCGGFVYRCPCLYCWGGGNPPSCFKANCNYLTDPCVPTNKPPGAFCNNWYGCQTIPTTP